MDKLLTVVVPVYKVEKYINKCLDSLIVPDELMEQLEVIVVNDGTPDRSAEMAREYEKKYPQTFRVIDKENGGHGSAWNRGLKEATGKYLRFLDSDDWFDNENFINLFYYLQKCDDDIIFSDMYFYHQWDNTYQLHRYPNMEANKSFDADSFDWNVLGGGEVTTNFHHCTYRTSMLQPLHPLFLEKQFYDDAILFVVPIVLSKTIIYYPGVIYNYLIGREGQTMMKNTMMKRYRDMENVIKSQITFVRNHRVSSKGKESKLYQTLSTMIKKHWKLLSHIPYSDSKKELKKWKQYIKKEYPEYSKSRLMTMYDILPFSVYWCVVNKIMKE